MGVVCSTNVLRRVNLFSLLPEERNGYSRLKRSRPYPRSNMIPSRALTSTISNRSNSVLRRLGHLSNTYVLLTATVGYLMAVVLMPSVESTPKSYLKER